MLAGDGDGENIVDVIGMSHDGVRGTPQPIPSSAKRLPRLGTRHVCRAYYVKTWCVWGFEISDLERLIPDAIGLWRKGAEIAEVNRLSPRIAVQPSL